MTTEVSTPEVTGANDGLRWVTTAEAAVVLGVSVDTVQRRVRSGALPCNRTAGGRVLIGLPEMPAAPQAPEDAPQGAETVPQDAPHVQGTDGDDGALLARLEALTAERDWLRERVEAAEREREQLRILLGAAVQASARALHPAPQAADPAPQPAPQAPPDPEPAPEPTVARWWRRVLVAVYG